MIALGPTLVQKAVEDRRLWEFSNEVLYRLCREHPDHNDQDVVLTKILFIGRIYAAAIERRKNKTVAGDAFYESTVVPKMIQSDLDIWIRRAKAVTPNTEESLGVMVEVHGLTTGLFHDISGLEKRSLASKYLHFHVPELFYLFDNRAAKNLGQLCPPKVSKKTGKGKVDNEYRKFAEKCHRLRMDFEKKFNRDLSPRDLDTVLLSLP